MNKFFRVITAPFRFLWWLVTRPFIYLWKLISWPFRSFKRVKTFLNEEPEEHPISDTISGIIQDKSFREMVWAEIDVFRTHLLRALLGLVVTIIISFLFTQRLIQYLARPIGGLEALRAIEVTESIGVFMRVALLTGIAIAMPYIVFEFWLFFAPGLRPRSKKFGLLGIPLATLLFLSGMAFAYYVMMPAALPFLLNFMGIQAQLRPQSYFNFVTGLMFWIGISFQFPLVIYVLTSIGFVKPNVLKEQWRIAIVFIAIMAAAITPTVDPVNMALVMLPMTLLYFVSIGLSYIAYRDREQKGLELSTDQQE